MEWFLCYEEVTVFVYTCEGWGWSIKRFQQSRRHDAVDLGAAINTLFHRLDHGKESAVSTYSPLLFQSGSITFDMLSVSSRPDWRMWVTWFKEGMYDNTKDPSCCFSSALVPSIKTESLENTYWDVGAKKFNFTKSKEWTLQWILTAEHAVTWSNISIPASAKATLDAMIAAARHALVPSFSNTCI